MSERPSGFGPIEATRPASLDGTRPAPLEATRPAPLERSAAPSAPATAGAMLRQMRESAGVDAGVLASAMKVSLQKIEALEHDRFDQLPDMTFARALTSAICRAFGVDPAPVLALMPAAAPGLRVPASEVNAPFHAASEGGSAAWSSAFSRPLLVVIAVLLLGAALLWLWPTWPIRLTEPEPAPVAAANPAESPTAAAEPVPAEPPAPPAAPGVAEAAAPAAAPAPAPPPEAAASAPAVSAAPLSLAASGESWVTVHDAHGKQLINRALQAGESVTLDGALPLSVTIGRKDMVQASVRGQPFDIRSLGPSTVARFQVK